MRSMQELVTAKVEAMAKECGLELAQTTAWSNCGNWYFRSEDTTVFACTYQFNDSYATAKLIDSADQVAFGRYHDDTEMQKKFFDPIAERIGLK